MVGGSKGDVVPEVEWVIMTCRAYRESYFVTGAKAAYGVILGLAPSKPPNKKMDQLKDMEKLLIGLWEEMFPVCSVMRLGMLRV